MKTNLYPGSKAQDDLVAVVFHELKTPLTIMTALLQVLVAKLDSMDEDTIRKSLTKTERQVSKMKKLVNGFLNAAYLESGKISVCKTTIKMDHLIGEIVEETRCMLTKQFIILDCVSPLVVNADREKIACVLSNLLCNAAKYSGKGNCIYVKCFRSATDVIVRIKDEGIGIKPENLEKVFERYFRADHDHTKKVEGFGIGLYLCASIVEQHGGRIWAESDASNGSTFYFSLPLT